MRYLTLEAPTLITDRQLNELADQGWELVTIVESHDLFYFYFRMV